MESNVRAPTDSPSILGLRDGRSYHLFKHGLLVFERALGPSGPFRVLLSRARVCTAPQCDCRDVSLSAIGYFFSSAIVLPIRTWTPIDTTIGVVIR